MGNGGSILFWTSHWVLPFPLLDLIPENQRGSLNLDQKVADFITNNTWDRIKLAQVLDDDLIDKILSIPLPRSNLQDKMIWGPNPNGSFTIKSAYNIQIQDRPFYPHADLLKKMWKLDIPPKVKIFAWMLIWNRLQVRARLHKFMPQISHEFPICQNQLEIIHHLFMEWCFAKDV